MMGKLDSIVVQAIGSTGFVGDVRGIVMIAGMQLGCDAGNRTVERDQL